MYTSYIWATNRMKYAKGRGQPYRGCLLCGVAKNAAGVIKKVVYRDKMMMVILNVFPYNAGHLQIVPIRHVENLEDLTPQEHQLFFDMIRRSVLLVKKTFKPAGINIGMNIGGDPSGGSVLHLHAQVVPRYKRDVGFMESTASVRVMPITLNEALKRFKKNVDILKK